MQQLQEFSDRRSAAVAAAALMARSLRESLVRAGEASLVVSGGTTPKQCFGILAAEPIDWASVSIVPSDERWVPPTDENSNERLIRDALMQGPAAVAKLLTFYRSGLDPADAPLAIEPELLSLPRPFSCALLGMGADGHFASLFPDFEGLDTALDTKGEEQCTMVRTAGSPFPRISLTLSALLDSHTLILLFFGEEKRTVFYRAVNRQGGYPVQALLSQTAVPVTTIWAP